MHLKKIISRKKLIKFWLFYSGNLKKIFKTNYQYLTVFYNKSCFLNLKNLSFSIKKLLPLFLDIVKNKEQFLFSSTSGLYSKSMTSNKYSSFVRDLNFPNKGGSFTNFASISFQLFTKSKFNPSVLILFYFNDPNFLVFEAKKKKIPLIGLVQSKNNSKLLEYPIFINGAFFFNVYFFSKLFFKLILNYKS